MGGPSRNGGGHIVCDCHYLVRRENIPGIRCACVILGRQTIIRHLPSTEWSAKPAREICSSRDSNMGAAARGGMCTRPRAPRSSPHPYTAPREVSARDCVSEASTSWRCNECAQMSADLTSIPRRRHAKASPAPRWRPLIALLSSSPPSPSPPTLLFRSRVQMSVATHSCLFQPANAERQWFLGIRLSQTVAE